MKSLLKIIVLLLVFTITSTAQTNDTIVAYQYFKKADSLLTDRKLNSSIAYFKKAIPLYEKARAWERVASCYNGISECFWRDYKSEKSLENAQKALEISKKRLNKYHSEIEESHINLAIVHEDLADYKNALNHYNKALDISINNLGKDHPKSAYIYSNMAGLFYRKGDLQKAEEFITKALYLYSKSEKQNLKEKYNAHNTASRILSSKGNLKKALYHQKKALEIAIAFFGKEHVETAYCYNDLGLIYRKLGSYNKALINNKKTINILEKENDIPPLTFALIYNNLGVLYRYKQDYHQALTNYKKGLSFIEKTNYQDEISLLYSNIAFALNEIGRYEKAFDYANRSLEIRKKIFQKDHPYIAECYRIIGYIFEKKLDFDKALHYHSIALNSNINTFGNNSLYVADCYNDIAENLIEKEKLNEAISQYNLALKSNTTPSDSLKKFDPANYLNWEVLLVTLKGKANAENAVYKIDNNVQNLKKAINTYKMADHTIAYVRQNLSEYKDKVIFANRSKDLYSQAIKTFVSSRNKTSDLNLLETSFYYAEKSKSNTLKELLNVSIAKTFSGLPENIINLEKTLATNKSYYQSKVGREKLNEQIDSIKLSTFENQLFDINKTQDSLTQILEKNYPKYYQLKYQNEVVSIKKIQQNLKQNTTLLEFFTDDSITYAFVISKNELTVQELKTPKLQNNIEEFRQSIIDQNIKTYKTQAYHLYQQLINPIHDQLTGKELIIIPDGPLWHLNFDLLITQDNPSNNPKDFSYLLKDYAITYANSATLLFNSFTSDKPHKKQQECLAFSFSNDTITDITDTKTIDLATLRDSDDDLPGTRKEIKAIADIIGGQYFYGPEANEGNFKKNAGQYNILHLALHGEVDNERPENSKLFFTKSKDTLEDNLLYSHELFAMDIPSELTVLSACNTGSGKIAKGEGIMSLGNAFQYAGTKSLLLTSWEVSDATTPEIMKYFYTHLKEGKNKAKALQQAKLKYLETSELNRTHPFYWGGFYLVGDPSSIQLSSNNYIGWIIGLGVLILIVLTIFWYKRKVKS
ncbi:CHAT domain-containing tetratricopeptide repeat protein [Aquimarina sp. 2201CG5-10]|uniref:CHAT domain-containing protein n=1 Tax=Aquimarina callyspongiae TaxID=3098150 RepID=UPI002AB52258|nr:CHAT domain-containing tetratricopeptide repeat protein [Aquimarina sp. 2201CG5-10]MDY8135247.1 CHAT domain-containing tetratricopeptide repeat protein [Aquimarina sp. 2201CG5-10]